MFPVHWSVKLCNISKKPVYKAKLNLLITNLLAWVYKTSFGVRDAPSILRQGRWRSSRITEFGDFCFSFSWRQIVASLTSFNRTYDSSTFQKCDPKLFSYLLEMFSSNLVLIITLLVFWGKLPPKLLIKNFTNVKMFLNYRKCDLIKFI